ncbi:MAG TPA: hydrogenase maturation protease [Smithella sp.]|nr:hydrogenase maturation protease [Smithella sp.]
MTRTIIIGYGNIDRSDDGVAYEVVNLVRQYLGRKILEDEDTGLDNLNGEIDSVFLPQLVPEMMELIAGYDQIIFVDAHAGDDMEDLNCSKVTPQYVSSTFTHHLTPEALLAFLKTLYQREPEAYMVSVRALEFDFKRSFSPKTQSLLRPASDKIIQLLKIKTC